MVSLGRAVRQDQKSYRNSWIGLGIDDEPVREGGLDAQTVPQADRGHLAPGIPLAIFRTAPFGAPGSSRGIFVHKPIEDGVKRKKTP